MSETASLSASPALEDISGGIRAFIIVMNIAVVVAISLRLWSRSINRELASGVRNGRRFWWDDWTALAALPFLFGLFGISYAMLFNGLGRHVQYVAPEELVVFLKLLYVIYFVYDFGLFCTKLSALLFLSRIFPWHANSRWFNYAIVAAHFLNVAWLLGIILGTVFMCHPVQKGWNPMMTGTCGETSALWVGSAIPSVCIDLIILALPMPKVWSLQMSRSRKLGVTSVLTLGYGVIVVSLGRMITVLRSGDSLNADITYSLVRISFWVAAEGPMTLVCICLPAMSSLGRHLTRRYFSILSSKMSSHSAPSSSEKKKDAPGIRGENRDTRTSSDAGPKRIGSKLACWTTPSSGDAGHQGPVSAGRHSAAINLTPRMFGQSFAAAEASASQVPLCGESSEQHPNKGPSCIRVDRAVTVSKSPHQV